MQQALEAGERPWSSFSIASISTLAGMPSTYSITSTRSVVYWKYTRGAWTCLRPLSVRRKSSVARFSLRYESSSPMMRRSSSIIRRHADGVAQVEGVGDAGEAGHQR